MFVTSRRCVHCASEAPVLRELEEWSTALIVTKIIPAPSGVLSFGQEVRMQRISRKGGLQEVEGNLEVLLAASAKCMR